MVGTKRFDAVLCMAAAVAVSLLGNHTAWGNMGPPPTSPIRTKAMKAAPLQVYVNPYEAETRIVISQNLVAQSVGAGSNATNDAQGPARSQASSTNVKSRTVTAGVTASILVIGGGLMTVLVRRRRGRAATGLGLALLAVLTTVVGTTVADIPPEASKRVRPSREAWPSTAFTPTGFLLTSSLDGEVVVESSSQVKGVVIYLGKDFAGKVHELTKPVPPESQGMGAFSGNGGLGDAPSTESGSFGGGSFTVEKNEP